MLRDPKTKYATSSEEAQDRASEYRTYDPFPDVKTTLLSSEHIKAYVRETAMIWPFEDSPEKLKSASYEVNPGGRFIYWDEQGNKNVQQIKKDGIFTLPANSISFVQLDAEFRLPQYVAVRFNLRITHVHRGLLLGTGPLVDPGFHGNLLIPLHNLTSDPYTIRGDEGLIWMEFTKTSHLADDSKRVRGPDDRLAETPARKSNQPPEYYFDKANKNRPIQSSLPPFVAEARSKAVTAERAAKRAQRSNSIFVGAGLLAIAGTVIGLFAFLEGVKGNVIAAYNLASSIGTTATEAASEARNAQEEAKRSSNAIQQLRMRLDQTNAEVHSLQSQIQQLTEQLRTQPPSTQHP